ncbi:MULTISPECIES: GNAT family N-acetyltransferase [Arthrobacter]|uniref:GNAT family N-acetyltransferase n=2 Tax=Arthrobacter TaxID=1663 RepID=A0ABU9KIS9_9MICC|nr:GNAT family N-acetyltransferase [Arthrobacter sp. YJM1]MDP5226065.1 GNAT family N-acetyltransferase [Arthrobacter sp. YJM1]
MSDLTTVTGLAALQNAAWPGLTTSDTGSWLLRAADGVTQRANSVWPYAAVEDLDAAIREAESWYRARRLPALFQLTSDPADAALDARLEALGYRVQTPTVLMVRDGSGAPVASSAVEVSPVLTQEWFDAWWLTSGHGRPEAAATARAILEKGDSHYALMRDDAGEVAAVGQSIRVGAFAGIYGMATREAQRRCGHARALLGTLLGADPEVTGFWLSVTRSNSGAQALYREAGFRPAGEYWYRSAPLTRGPTGC